jgi:hypothetical protein
VRRSGRSVAPATPAAERLAALAAAPTALRVRPLAELRDVRVERALLLGRQDRADLGAVTLGERLHAGAELRAGGAVGAGRAVRRTTHLLDERATLLGVLLIDRAELRPLRLRELDAAQKRAPVPLAPRAARATVARVGTILPLLAGPGLGGRDLCGGDQEDGAERRDASCLHRLYLIASVAHHARHFGVADAASTEALSRFANIWFWNAPRLLARDEERGIFSAAVGVAWHEHRLSWSARLVRADRTPSLPSSRAERLIGP